MRKALALMLLAALLLAASCAQQPTDAAIATDLKARMFSDPELKALNLDIAVRNGEITLSGEVPNPALQLKAFKLASTIPGASRIVDAMKLQLTETKGPPGAGEPEAPKAQEPKVPQRPQPPPARAESPRNQPRPRPVDAQAGGTPKAAPQSPAAAPSTIAPASPAATAPAPVAPADTAAQKTKVEAPIQAAAPVAPPRPQKSQAVIPTDTAVAIRMVDPIDSAINTVGEVFRATLDAAIVVDGEELVPEKTELFVELVQARSAGRMTGQSELELALHSMEFGGQTYRLSSTSYQQIGKSRGKDTALKVGIASGIGAAIGAIAGGGKGAVIGAGVGAGAGATVQAVTRGQQVKVPQETLLEFRLKAPVSIPYTPGAATRSKMNK